MINMIIGGPLHGKWVTIQENAHTLAMIEPAERRSIADPVMINPTGELPEIVHLPLMAFRCPGWRIALYFWAHPSLQLYSGGRMPRGSVMPGWIEGEALSSEWIAPDGYPDGWVEFLEWLQKRKRQEQG